MKCSARCGGYGWLVGMVGLGAIGHPGLARAQAEDVLPPQIVHEPCEAYTEGQDFVVRARFYDTSRIFDPKVIYRSAGRNFRNAPFIQDPGSEDFVATVPGRFLKGKVEYFIEAFDENGNGPARYGSPEAPVEVEGSKTPVECEQLPHRLSPITTAPGSQETPTGKLPNPALTRSGPPPSTCELEDRPLYCEGWLWGTIGTVAAVGLGVGIYFLVREGGPLNPDDDPSIPGTVNVGVSAPAPVSILPWSRW